MEAAVGGLQRAKLFKYVDETLDQDVEVPEEDVIGAYKVRGGGLLRATPVFCAAGDTVPCPRLRRVSYR